jgi:hypothetical protein
LNIVDSIRAPRDSEASVAGHPKQGADMTHDVEVTKRFVIANADYQVALDEQGRTFATREPRDLGGADLEVRASLKALIADLD